MHQVTWPSLKAACAWSSAQPGSSFTPTRHARRALGAAHRAMVPTRAAASAAHKACHRCTMGDVSQHAPLALLQTPPVPVSRAQANAPRAMPQRLPAIVRRAMRLQVSRFCLTVTASAIALLASLDPDKRTNASASFACRLACVASAQLASVSCAQRAFTCSTGSAP